MNPQAFRSPYSGLLERWMLDPELPPTAIPTGTPPAGTSAAGPAPTQAIDQCRFVQLPQNPAGGGYYTYGTPARGKGQYGLPDTIKLIQDVGRQSSGGAFGVGNISLANGGKFKGHGMHRNGANVDIRPLRTDGAQTRADWRNRGYDRAATQRLIDAFRATGMVGNIWFNDPAIKGVTPMKGHNDHFHVNVRSPCLKR